MDHTCYGAKFLGATPDDAYQNCAQCAADRNDLRKGSCKHGTSNRAFHCESCAREATT